MSETAIEGSLQSSNEKEESLQSDTSEITDSSGVEHLGISAQSYSNKENLIETEVTEAVSDKGACSDEQLDGIICSIKMSEETDIIDTQGIDKGACSDEQLDGIICSIKMSEETDIIDTQGIYRVNSNIESEESQHSEATAILVPPKEFCDASQHEANLISLDPVDIIEQKNTVVEFVVSGMSVTEFLNYTSEVVTCKEISNDNQIQESNIETNKEKVIFENLPEDNLIDLENPSSVLKGCSINEVIQAAVNEQVEVSQCDNNNVSENIEEIETPENINLVCKISLNNAQVDLISANENELQVSQQDETVDDFDKEEKQEEMRIPKNEDSNVLIQIEDLVSDSSMENNPLKDEDSQLEKINNVLEVNILETDKNEICESFADITVKELTNENDPFITTNEHSINMQNQLISINENYLDDQAVDKVNDVLVVHEDNVNSEILESGDNFNAKEASSIEVKDIDMTVVRDCQLTNELNIQQDQNIVSTESEMSQIESGHEVSSLLEVESNQAQIVEKEILQDETIVKYSETSEAASFTEVCDVLEVETNSKRNRSSVSDESLLEIKDETSENIGNDISEPNCRSVNDNIADSVETILQEGKKKELQETANLNTDNDSKSIHNEKEEKKSENTEKMYLSSQKLIEEIVTVDNVSSSIIVDNSNKIEDKISVEDKKSITKDEASLKMDQKDISIKKDDTSTVQCAETENKDLPAIDRLPEVLIHSLQGMKWLKSNQSNEVNQTTKQMKSLPKKNERADENLFEGTTKRNANKRRRSGHNRNDKANTAQLKVSELKNLQKSQVSQLRTETEQMKKEACPSVWNNNTTKQLFPNPSTEAVVIDRIKEEEDLSIALVESICTAQQESERRKMSETNLKIKIMDEADDDHWGKVHRNLPKDEKDMNQSTAKGLVDKYGRVDGYTEKHMFMGKNGRRREQEFLKSQTENKSQMQLTQTKSFESKSQIVPTQPKPSENKAQIRPIQTKSFEANVAQSKPNSRAETSSRSQNADQPKKEMQQASKCQERPIQGRAGKDGPPGQVEMQKPGFNRSATQNPADNASQTRAKNQESAYKNQQTFSQQRRYPESANRGIEDTNIQQSKGQSFPDRNQGNVFRNQDQSNQSHSRTDKNVEQSSKCQNLSVHMNKKQGHSDQVIQSHINLDQTNMGQSSDQLSKGQNSSDQLNKHVTNHDSLNKNQVYTDRTGTDSTRNQDCLKQNQTHSDRNQVENRTNPGQVQNQAYSDRNQGNPIQTTRTISGQTQNQAYSDRNQGNSVQNRTNFGQAQNQTYSNRNQGNTVQNWPNPGQIQSQNYSDKATSNVARVQDNTRQHQTNLVTNQGHSDQKQVSSVQSQNYPDKIQSQVTQINASRDQDNFNRNQNYQDRHHCNALRNQDGYRNQDSFRSHDSYRHQDSYRNQDGYKNQDSYRNQGYTDNMTKHQDNYNKVQNNSDRTHGSQNYSDRSRGNQSNLDRNYVGRVQDSYNKHQNYSDNNKGNYQNTYCSDRNKDNAFKSHDIHRGNQSQDNQLKYLDSYGKNQSYGTRQQENVKQINENESKVPTEENWDDDQSNFKSSQQVYNQRAIKSQDSKIDHQNSSLKNKKVGVEKTVGVQETATPTSTTYGDVGSSQVHLTANSIIKATEIKPELTIVKKVDVEPRPNIVMAFDGNANIQRALGLDRSTYNQATVSSATVSTTLSQLLNSTVSQSLPLTQATSEIPANYDVAVMCTGGTMNVNAPPFNSSNFAAAPFSTDLEVANFVNSSFEVSDVPNSTALRMGEIANNSEEYLQAHRTVSTLSKQLAAAEAKLLALNVKFYNECMSSASAQNSTTIPSVGTVGDIQPQQSRPIAVSDFVAVQHAMQSSFQAPTTGVQNIVTPVAFDASRNFATGCIPEMTNEAYQLNAAFQQRLSLQSVYVPQGGMYQPQAAATYQPQTAANYETQTALNYQQYSANVNAANRLQRGRGTPPNGEQKDLRVGGHQFYNQ